MGLTADLGLTIASVLSPIEVTSVVQVRSYWGPLFIGLLVIFNLPGDLDLQTTRLFPTWSLLAGFLIIRRFPGLTLPLKREIPMCESISVPLMCTYTSKFNLKHMYRHICSRS